MYIAYEMTIIEFIINYILPKYLPYLIGVLLLIVGFVFIYKQVKRKTESELWVSIKKQVRHPKVLGAILVILVIVQFGALGLFYINSSISSVTHIIDYLSGNYHVAAGEIVQYSPYMGNSDSVLYPYYGKHETFYVNDVFFSLVDGLSLGYDIPAANGGFITQNGQKVEIYYITDDNGMNHIMKLLVEEDNTGDGKTGDGSMSRSEQS